MHVDMCMIPAVFSSCLWREGGGAAGKAGGRRGGREQWENLNFLCCLAREGRGLGETRPSITSLQGSRVEYLDNISCV